VEAIGVFLAFDKAVAWQVWQLWKVICPDLCRML